MQTEEAAPPTEQMRAVRDIEFVRMAQLRYAEGYHARLAEPHPMKRNASGRELQQREPRWRFCEVDGKGEVDPQHAWGRCPGQNPPISEQAWPTHESERWVAGYIHADGICAERGLSAAKTADPTHIPRKVRQFVAEPIEAFPDAILSRENAREYHARQDRIRHGQSGTLVPTTVDG